MIFWIFLECIDCVNAYINAVEAIQEEQGSIYAVSVETDRNAIQEKQGNWNDNIY